MEADDPLNAECGLGQVARVLMGIGGIALAATAGFIGMWLTIAKRAFGDFN